MCLLHFLSFLQMDVNILDIAPVLSDIKTCIAYLRGRNLLLNDYFCCETQCSKVMDISLNDREIFQCNQCHKRFSIRTNSFWSGSHLSLCVLVGLLYFFCVGSSITEVLKFFKRKVSKPVTIKWYNYFRDIMTTHLVNNPVSFQNCTVHINETFLHKEP